MATTRDKREKRKTQYASARKAAESRAGGDFTSIVIPEGMRLFKPKGGMKYNLDFLPYKVGEGNPQASPGVMYYERTYWVHRGVGPNNETHICLAKTMRQKCPVCQKYDKMKSDPEVEKETKNALLPKQRQLFLVIDQGDKEAGVQLFDISYHNFGKQLDEEIGNSEPEDRYENFFHRKGGMTLKCSFKEESGGGYKYVSIGSIHFRPRNPIPLETVQGLPCLDKLLKPLEYDQLRKLFLQISDDESKRPDDDEVEDDEIDDDSEADDDDSDEDDEPSSKGRRRAPSDDDEDEDDDDE